MDRLLIANARIVDGSGAPWFRGEVLVDGGRIAAVGHGLDARGAARFDAGDRYLAPGFIDTHCHDDLIFLREPSRPEKAAQGVTSIVVGNCSFSLFPRADGLRAHFGSLLGEVAEDEIFADFGAYRARLEGQGIALNLIGLVGHAALRLAVVGPDDRPATAAERAAMQALLARQLDQGAAGLSLGLVYPPSAYADEAELRALAETVAAHGAILAAHVRSYEGGLIGSVDEFIGIVRAAKAIGLLSHLQAAGRPYWGSVPKAIARLEAARAEGVDISFDMYPYPAGSSTILQLLPPSAQAGGIERLLQRLAASADALRGAQPWYVEAHPFRIDTTDGIGRPTPEGAHRDGVDLVAVFLVGRHAIKGGESRVFEANGPNGQRFTLRDPWSLLLLDDPRVIHESTPIQPEDPEGHGWRDTLVVTLRAGGFQGG